MDLHSIERAADSFQQPVTAAQIQALCRRSLGADVRVTAATEIGVGTYNSTYRLDLEREAPVVLRIAPTPARQSPADRDAMRNEYAAAPFLAPLGLLVPRILAGAAAEVRGAAAVAETFSGRAQAARLALIDRAAGAAWLVGGQLKVVFDFTIIDGRVTAIELLADPAVLHEFDVELLPSAR